jgi:hypothetical protein
MANNHGLIGTAAKCLEMPERSQIAFLRRILGIGRIAQKIARKRVDIVEIRQSGGAKTLRLATIAAALVRHAVVPHRRITVAA